MNAKVPVPERALIKRINLRLPPNVSVRITRFAKSVDELGYFYIHDSRLNDILDVHIDLDGLGRQLGVLKSWESVGG